MFGPAQYGVAKAVADSVAEGVIPMSQADDLFICVGVFIHWEANDDQKIQDFNYTATKEAIARAMKGDPTRAQRAVGPRHRETSFRRQLIFGGSLAKGASGLPFFLCSDVKRSRSARVRAPSCSAVATSAPAAPIASSRSRSNASRTPPAAKTRRSPRALDDLRDAAKSGPASDADARERHDDDSYAATASGIRRAHLGPKKTSSRKSSERTTSGSCLREHAGIHRRAAFRCRSHVRCALRRASRRDGRRRRP